MAGMPVPDADHYDGYPQIEDGIGITRHFLENLESYLGRAGAGSLKGMAATVACGTLIGDTMRGAVDRLNRHTGSMLDVRVVENGFFGSEINISGLLTGGDLVRSFGTAGSSQPLYISSRMISDRTQTLLDDITVADLAAQLGRPVAPCLTLADVARDLKQRRAEPKAA